jgi:hypothetical protein
MPEVRDTTNRADKWIDYVLLPLAVAWAVGWMVFYVWLVAAYAAADDIAWEDLPVCTGIWLLWCFVPAFVLWRQRSRLVKRRKVKRAQYQAAKRYHQTGEKLTGFNLSHAELTDTDLSKADLRGANLMNADLSGANLEGADLSKANLEGADMRGALLKEATLDQANMRRANLREAKLQRASLWRAKLHRARLEGANLQAAHLLQAVLERARLDDSTVMPQGWEEMVAHNP